MTQEQWEKIQALFHAALERSPSSREAFLAEACGSDQDLKRKIESLLAHEPSSPGGILDGPAWQNASNLLTETQLGPGTQIGPYKIDGLLGSGGMGRVFRALDTRLGRSVAIKFSDERFTPRFEREARAIAQLNHPRICTLYDVGPNYLVMELVEGETLAAKVKKGALELALVLKLGSQIAEALAVAHTKGIIHRDLKPQNIMIAKGGVKVLDFGLAKTPEDESLTAANAVMGTPAYMAPEQREGRPADARTDLYALGLVLAEMATGMRQNPNDPPTSRIPSQLRRIVERCLARDPEDRWQSAADLKAALELIADVPDLSPDASTAPGLSRRQLLASSATAAIVGAAGGYWLHPAASAKAQRFSILPPDGTTFLTVQDAGAPALSPDGKMIAFVAKGPAGQMLWVRSIDAFDERPLVGTEDATYPFWSPTGQSLGFIVQGMVKTVALAGGLPEGLISAAGSGSPGSWSQDDKILLSSGYALFTISAKGGQQVFVTERNPEVFDENQRDPHFLPDGRHYLVQIRGGPELGFQLWLGEIGSNTRRVLLKDVTNAQYSPPRRGAPGRLLYVRDRTLMARTFDAETLALVGEPIQIGERIAVSARGDRADFSISRNGVLAYRLGEVGKQEMIWYNDKGEPLRSLGDRPGNPRSGLRISPDEKSVAFTRRGSDVTDVWIQDLNGDPASPFTLNGGRSPTWSPDSLQIAYVREDTIYRKAVNGGGQEEALWSGPGVLVLNDWSGDGRYLLFTRWETKTGRGLWLLPDPLIVSAKHEPIPLEASALHGQFVPGKGAPKGYSFDKEGDGGRREIYLRSMPGEGSHFQQVSIEGGNASRVRRDGKQIFYTTGKQFMVAPLNPDLLTREGTPKPLFPIPLGILTAGAHYAPGYDVSADGTRFLATNPSSVTPPTAIQIVTNWDTNLAT